MGPVAAVPVIPGVASLAAERAMDKCGFTPPIHMLCFAVGLSVAVAGATDRVPPRRKESSAGLSGIGDDERSPPPAKFAALKKLFGLLHWNRYTSAARFSMVIQAIAYGGHVHLIGPAAASFSLCLLAMFALRPLAIAVKLIDRPGERKLHAGEVPVVGGLGMLLGMVLGMGLLPLPDWTAGTLLAASSILVTVGLIDDRFELSPWTRLPVQIASAVVLIIGARAAVATVGSPFGEEIQLDGIVSFVFTVVIIVAAINAFNMLDGMDGLAGALAIVSLAALAFLAHAGGAVAALSVSVVMMGAVAAFLLSNLPISFNRDVRCFMGDSGSTLLGISVAWLCIAVSQAPDHAARPVTMLWVVALPLYELSWTVIRRTIRGISPFKPDNGHLHHLVLQAGFGVRGAFVLFVALAVLLAFFGVTVDRLGMSDSWSFALLISVGGVIVWLLYQPDLIWKLVPRPLRRGRPVVQD